MPRRRCRMQSLRLGREKALLTSANVVSSMSSGRPKYSSHVKRGLLVIVDIRCQRVLAFTCAGEEEDEAAARRCVRSACFRVKPREGRVAERGTLFQRPTPATAPCP